MPVRVNTPALKELERPPKLPTVRVSPVIKPPMVTVALASVELVASLTVRPASSTTAEPPPVKVAVEPAVTVGGDGSKSAA